MPFLRPLMQEEKKQATHRHIRISRIERVGSCHPIKLSTSSFLRLGVRSTKGSNATPTRHLPKQQLTSQTNTMAKQHPTRSRPGCDHVLNDTIVSAVHTLEYKRQAGAGGGDPGQNGTSRLHLPLIFLSSPAALSTGAQRGMEQ